MSRRRYTILTCNRCGTEHVGNGRYPDGWVILLQRDNTFEGKDHPLDLCEPCRLLLEKFLSSGVEQ